MNMESRDEKKKKNLKKLIRSFGFSIEGLKYAYTYKQNMFIHCIVTILIIIFGFVLKINSIEWFFVFLFIGLVSAAELFNTAIEALTDLVSPEFHPLAKIVKDTASAAVMMLAFSAFCVGVIIYIPKLYDFIIGFI